MQMQISIGKNLKHLRKNRDITQDELATQLGVSFQAVTKWERGDTYPDITMLPALANFFGVTTDELIGMEGINNRENMWNLHKSVNDLQRAGRYEEATMLLREKLKLHPNDKGLISSLAITQVMAHHNAAQAQPIYNEAIEHFETYLDIGRNEKFHSYVRATLVFLYHGVGQRDKAQEFAATLPHIWESRELLSIEMLDGDEYITALKHTVILALSILADKIRDINSREDVAIVKSKHINHMWLGWPSEGDVKEKIDKITEFIM